MKFSATREQLLGPVQAVIGVVERKQTMPVLANLLLAAKGGRLSVTGTDLEVELVASGEVNVVQPARSLSLVASCSISPRHCRRAVRSPSPSMARS